MDEKEYQAGVWYGADTKPPKGAICLVSGLTDACGASRTWYWLCEEQDGSFEGLYDNAEYDMCDFWMLIPEPPKDWQP